MISLDAFGIESPQMAQLMVYVAGEGLVKHPEQFTEL
jgi:hypothetical protein